MYRRPLCTGGRYVPASVMYRRPLCTGGRLVEGRWLHLLCIYRLSRLVSQAAEFCRHFSGVGCESQHVLAELYLGRETRDKIMSCLRAALYFKFPLLKCWLVSQLWSEAIFYQSAGFSNCSFASACGGVHTNIKFVTVWTHLCILQETFQL
jgi:hypothetical protein